MAQLTDFVVGKAKKRVLRKKKKRVIELASLPDEETVESPASLDDVSESRSNPMAEIPADDDPSRFMGEFSVGVGKR